MFPKRILIAGVAVAATGTGGTILSAINEGRDRVAEAREVYENLGSSIQEFSVEGGLFPWSKESADAVIGLSGCTVSLDDVPGVNQPYLAKVGETWGIVRDVAGEAVPRQLTPADLQQQLGNLCTGNQPVDFTR